MGQKLKKRFPEKPFDLQAHYQNRRFRGMFELKLLLKCAVLYGPIANSKKRSSKPANSEHLRPKRSKNFGKHGLNDVL